jgi:hypothetical protein
MEYVIPAVLVVLLVGGLVTFLVLNATEKSGPAARGDDGPPGIGGDPAPLGDTTEHSGERSEGGATRQGPGDAAHVGRPGEGEGAERLDFDREQPRSASGRPADRDA